MAQKKEKMYQTLMNTQYFCWLCTSDVLKITDSHIFYSSTLHLHMHCYTDMGKSLSIFGSLLLCKYCSDHDAKALLVINDEKLPKIIKSYKINRGNYTNGNTNMSDKEEM